MDANGILQERLHFKLDDLENTYADLFVNDEHIINDARHFLVASLLANLDPPAIKLFIRADRRLLDALRPDSPISRLLRTAYNIFFNMELHNTFGINNVFGYRLLSAQLRDDDRFVNDMNNLRLKSEGDDSKSTIGMVRRQEETDMVKLTVRINLRTELEKAEREMDKYRVKLCGDFAIGEVTVRLERQTLQDDEDTETQKYRVKPRSDLAVGEVTVRLERQTLQDDEDMEML